MTPTQENDPAEERVAHVIRAHFRRMGIEYHDGPDSPDDVIARSVVRELAPELQRLAVTPLTA